uniref:Uncharacterized protein n=1 Tax=Desertifilum tharense IPPAS B-1220 TaxID=1781255 RepID=A0ACD5GN20_9CYAN
MELEEQKGWRLTTASTPPEWGLITLRQSSYLDTTPDLETARFGLNGGAIDIRGRGLTLQEGSSIETGTGSFGQGENLTVRTTEFVDLLGVSSELNFPNPGLYSNASGERAIAGDIIVETERLRLANGARLQSGVNARVDPITSEPI